MIPKIISFYFPQFHSFPENDSWWGKNFTDWKLVKEAKPNYKGHNQPRIPLNNDYYNPCDKNTLVKQIKLAKEYNISGFMFYHYWFDGKLYLQKPLEMFLKNKDLDFEFCICWANETWTRSWIGRPDIILQEQKHTPDHKIWSDHFNYLLPFLKDNRCIKFNGLPVITIFQPHLIKKTKDMFDLWKKLAKANGLNGLYIIAIKNFQNISEDLLSNYDGVMKFQPREAYNSKEFSNLNLAAKFQYLRLLPEYAINKLRKLKHSLYTYNVISSNKIWDIILNNAYKYDSVKPIDIYESAFFEWDNTPRYGSKSKIFNGMNFVDMEKKLTSLLLKAHEANSHYVFFNAWNEWSECAYLEPDEKNKYKYLEIIRASTENIKS